MILVVCLNPTLQKTILLEDLRENEVNRSAEHRLDASGKGVNVHRVLVQLGKRSVHLTHAGGIFEGLFLSLCGKDGLDVRTVPSDSEIRFCTTLLNQSGHTTTEIVEEPRPVGPRTETLVREAFERLLPEADGLIISGTKTPGYSAGLYPWMVRQARERKILTSLDIKGSDLLACLEERPDLIKPNLSEFSGTFFPQASASEHAENPELERLVREKMESILRETGTRVVLTAGKRKILYTDRQGVRTLQPQAVQAVNTIGCGDAMTAGLVSGLLGGETLDEAVVRGADCAAKNAGLFRPGVIR